MSIDYIRKKVYENKLDKEREGLTAQGMHDEMKTDIAQIANSRGFIQIVDYWKRELDLHNGRLEEIQEAISQGKVIDEKHINLVLANRAVVNKFLTFLVNILSD